MDRFFYFLILLLVCFSSCNEDKAVLDQTIDYSAMDLSNPPDTLWGVDVSHYQGKIDFDDLEEGAHFVILRASIGPNGKCDQLFYGNYAKAAKSKLLLGFYHFFYFDRDGELQAKIFLDATNGKRNNFPLIIDFEESKVVNNPKEMNVDTSVYNLRKMVDYLQSQGKDVMIYSNRHCYAKYKIASNFPGVKLWVADYNAMFVTEDFPDCYIQQYACDGKVYGIHADVDLNVIVDSKMIITPEKQPQQ
jgi:lysozyme